MTLLDSRVGRDVNSTAGADLELGEVVVFTDVPDPFAHSAAAGEDPLVGPGGTWHASTLPTS